MQITTANPAHIADLITFFNEHLDSNNSAIYSEEFLCPLGIKAAVNRKQMIVAVVDGQLVGAFRFYRKKTQNKISLYQFALREDYRGKSLLKKMLQTINDVPIVALCPFDSEFNYYFIKTGWKQQRQIDEFNVWDLNGADSHHAI